jgi:hypothetical protein
VRRKVNEWEMERPPDEAVLVRGAPLIPELLAKSARRPLRRFHFYGLSVFTFPRSTPQEIATRAELPHDQICTCLAREVRSEGFDVRMTDRSRPGHASLVFPREPSPLDIDNVIRIFGQPFPNATKQGR